MVIILLKNPSNEKVIAVTEKGAGDDEIAKFDDEFAAECWIAESPLGRAWPYQIVELEM
jgi:hypothetical protein